MKDLKNLNTVYKADYIDLILENDTEVAGYVENKERQVVDAEDQVEEVIMEIQDTKDQWDMNMREIN